MPAGSRGSEGGGSGPAGATAVIVGCRRRVCGCDQGERCAIYRASCAISWGSCAISWAGVRDFSGGKRDFSGRNVDDKDWDASQGRDRRQAHMGAASRGRWGARWSWRAGAIGGADGVASHAVVQQNPHPPWPACATTYKTETGHGSGPCVGKEGVSTRGSAEF